MATSAQIVTKFPRDVLVPSGGIHGGEESAPDIPTRGDSNLHLMCSFQEEVGEVPVPLASAWLQQLDFLSAVSGTTSSFLSPPIAFSLTVSL